MPRLNTPYSLYLLSCEFTRIDTALDELSQILKESDHLMLLDDAVHALNFANKSTFNNIIILDQDAGLIPPYLETEIKIINYTQFAQIIDQASTVHTWK